MSNYKQETTIGRMLTLDAMRGGAALAVVTNHAIAIIRRCSKAKGISSDWKNGGHKQ